MQFQLNIGFEIEVLDDDVCWRAYFKSCWYQKHYLKWKSKSDPILYIELGLLRPSLQLPLQLIIKGKYIGFIIESFSSLFLSFAFDILQILRELEIEFCTLPLHAQAFNFKINFMLIHQTSYAQRMCTYMYCLLFNGLWNPHLLSLYGKYYRQKIFILHVWTMLCMHS